MANANTLVENNTSDYCIAKKSQTAWVQIERVIWYVFPQLVANQSILWNEKCGINIVLPQSIILQ